MRGSKRASCKAPTSKNLLLYTEREKLHFYETHNAPDEVKIKIRDFFLQ